MPLLLVTRDAVSIQARKRLRDLYGQMGSWRAVGYELKINPGLLNAVANGRKRAPNSVLRALGLPLRLLPAPACIQCGQVHVSKRCIAMARARRQAGPRRNWKRLAGWLTMLLMINQYVEGGRVSGSGKRQEVVYEPER